MWTDDTPTRTQRTLYFVLDHFGWFMALLLGAGMVLIALVNGVN